MIGRGELVVLSIGSNLGDRMDNIQGALDALCDAPGLEVVAVSPVYETEPFGGPEQDDFLNAVIVVRSAVPPQALLERTRGIEDAFGRTRDVRWGPRTLDIDLIVFGAHRRTDPELTLPHPRAHERAFVLVPWLDVDPDACLPGYGPVASVVAGVDSSGVRRRDDLSLRPPE